MSHFNTKIFLSLFFNIFAYIAWGQPPKPNICNTPPAGYLAGGRFTFTPAISCLQPSQANSDITLTNVTDPNLGFRVDSPNFYFNVDNNFNVNAPTNGLTTNGQTAIANTPDGAFWVVMTGTRGANNYLSCSMVEVLKTVQPEVKVSDCGSNTTTVTIGASNKYDRININWGNSTQDVINISSVTLPYTITKTNLTSQITVEGIYIRNSSVVCKSNPYTPTKDQENAPFIHTLTGDDFGKEAKIEFINYKPGLTYDILAKPDDGSTNEIWTQLAQGVNGQARVTGLNQTLRYCFKTRTKNSCGNDVFSMNTVCTVNIKATLKSTSEAELRWNLPTLPLAIPVQNRLYQEQKGCATCSNIIPLSGFNTTKYDAKNLKCGNIYLYKMQYRYPTTIVNGAAWPVNIISAQIEVDPKSNSAVVKPNDLVSVGYVADDDQKIEIIISDVSIGNKYTFYRSENGIDYLKLGERPTARFEDVALSPEPKSYCYKYTKEDNCGVSSSMSNPFCTILLGSKNQGVLNWTSFLVPPDVYKSASPVDYSVEYYDEGLSSFIPYQSTSNLNQSVQQLILSAEQSEIKFRVMGKQFIDTETFSNQFISSYSNTFIIKVPPGIFIPSAFSPDGQGPVESEQFKINSKFVSEGSIKIFDRWGSVVFEGNALTDAWNGSEANGITPAPSGSYAYVIRAVSDTGIEFKMSGTVILMR
jgi:gliding motility-associated-like protein